MTGIAKPNYLAQAKKLGKEDAERLFSRMTGKLPRRLQKDKLTKEEALAIQLELEDERLEEWREMMQHVRAREKAKAEKKEAEAKKDARKQSAAAPKASAASKAPKAPAAKKAAKPKSAK